MRAGAGAVQPGRRQRPRRPGDRLLRLVGALHFALPLRRRGIADQRARRGLEQAVAEREDRDPGHQQGHGRMQRQQRDHGKTEPVDHEAGRGDAALAEARLQPRGGESLADDVHDTHAGQHQADAGRLEREQILQQHRQVRLQHGAAQRKTEHDREQQAQARRAQCAQQLADGVELAPVQAHGAAGVRMAFGHAEPDQHAVEQRQRGRTIQRRRQRDLSERAAEDRSHHEAKATGRAEHAESRPAFGRAVGVGNVRIQRRDAAGRQAFDHPAQHQHPQRAADAEHGESQRGAAQRHQHDRTPAEPVAQRAQHGRRDERTERIQGEDQRYPPGDAGCRDVARHRKRQHRDDQREAGEIEEHGDGDDAGAPAKTGKERGESGRRCIHGRLLCRLFDRSSAST